MRYRRDGMVWYGMVWCGMVWYGVVWYGMVWYGMALCAVWCGVVWYWHDARLHRDEVVEEGTVREELTHRRHEGRGHLGLSRCGGMLLALAHVRQQHRRASDEENGADQLCAAAAACNIDVPVQRRRRRRMKGQVRFEGCALFREGDRTGRKAGRGGGRVCRRVR
jgi:hypothetical protein